jgi:putative membrane protein
MLFWLAILIAIVAGVVWFIRQGTLGGSGSASHRDQAIEVLRERYARGEISKEEFDRMRQDLV